MKYVLSGDIMQHRIALCTDVSGQPIVPIFKEQAFQEEASNRAFYMNVGIRFAECCIFITKTHDRCSQWDCGMESVKV